MMTQFPSLTCIDGIIQMRIKSLSNKDIHLYVCVSLWHFHEGFEEFSSVCEQILRFSFFTLIRFIRHRHSDRMAERKTTNFR